MTDTGVQAIVARARIAQAEYEKNGSQQRYDLSLIHISEPTRPY